MAVLTIGFISISFLIWIEHALLKRISQPSPVFSALVQSGLGAPKLDPSQMKPG